MDINGTRRDGNSHTHGHFAGPFRIVAGVDGSDESIAALRRARHLAELTGAHLEVVTSWDPTAFGQVTALGWDAERQARTVLAYCVESVFGQRAPAWVSAIAEGGLPAEVLVARSYDADMLVLGKKSHRALTDLVMGSVSVRCANTAACPVLIVPLDASDIEHPANPARSFV